MVQNQLEKMQEDMRFSIAAIRELLNQYPGLLEGEIIKFEELKEESGIAFSADSGALVFSEKKKMFAEQ